MPRLPNMTNRDDAPEALRDAFDQVAALRNGTVSGPYGVLLHSPELAITGAALGNYVRWRSDLTAAQRETAILTAARHFNAAVMWAGHVRLGREAGVREEVIDTIAARGDLTTLTDEEADIVRFVDELFANNRISDDTFAALHARLGDQGIVDITGLVGYYAFVGTTLNTFQLEPPAGSPKLP
jgi:4-carboxymuconolactone decarboxylase